MSRFLASLRFVILGLALGALNVPGRLVAQVESSATAFVGVNVVAMDGERVTPEATVVVIGDRITGIGAVADVAIPDGAAVIDAHGRYLLPGLFDAHAHLDPEVMARPDFGEAPLYLAFGVTSVVSMKGDPEHLRIRDRMRRGERIAPNLYTAGPFLNEPLIKTPAEARAEVQRQASSGYDLIKFHEVYEYNTDDHFSGGITYLTSDGVDRPTLEAMVAAARNANVPAIGHIPTRDGLAGSLETGLSLAHSSVLLGAHFWPSGTDRFRRHAGALRIGIVLLLAAIGLWVVERVITRLIGREAHTSILAGVGSVAIVGLFFWSRRSISTYRWLGDEARVLGWTAVAIAVIGIAIVFAYLTIVALRPGASPWRRLQLVLSTIGAMIVAASVAVFWLPVLHRSTPGGLDRLANDISDAGVWVQTTLSVEDTLVLREIPELEYLHPTKERANRAWADRWSPERVDLVRRGLPFFESVVAALDRADVPLMLGTDAMGFPLIVPGVSVHDEIRLLTSAGLTPYRILRTATVQPATFLGVEDEVGTIAVGKRADLLLVGANPLEDIETLRSPIGVMVRGKWLSRDWLLENLETIRGPDPISDVIDATIEHEGIDAAVELYWELRNSAVETYVFNEAELNSLGYQYIRQGDLATAIRVFELNVEAYPHAANPYDSLGEAYLAAGDREKAIENYRKSLELNPGNDNARRVLDELADDVE